MNNNDFAKVLNGLNALIQELTLEVYIKDATIKRLEEELGKAESEKYMAQQKVAELEEAAEVSK